MSADQTDTQKDLTASRLSGVPVDPELFALMREMDRLMSWVDPQDRHAVLNFLVHKLLGSHLIIGHFE